MIGRIGVAVAVVASSLALAATASAADWQLGQADAVASSVAGHGVSVYCEDSRAEWVDVERAMGLDGDSLGGFTWAPGSPDPFGNVDTVYVQPESCTALHLFAQGWGTNWAAQDAGLYWLAMAGSVLVHESVHQRGISDEGMAECTAYRLMPTAWTSQFGIRKTARVKTVVRHRVRYRTVANPVYVRLMQWTKAIHDTLSPAYRTVC